MPPAVDSPAGLSVIARPRGAWVWPRVLDGGRSLWREHRALALVALLFWATMTLVGPLADWPGSIGFGFHARTFFAILIFVLGWQAWRVRYALHRADATLPPREAWRRSLGPVAERLPGAVLAGLLTALVLATFGGWKQAIPHAVPFAWDVTFMQLDRALHGGVHPWELLAPLLQYPTLIRALDVAYFAVWGMAVGVTLVWVCAANPSPLRTQFLVSHALTWVFLGSLLATALSSGGPFVFGAVTGLADPYAPLMERLRAIDADTPLMALTSQRALWAAHSATPRVVLLHGGISAMPSLHIAMATLLALLAWRRAWWVGAAATIFLGVVLVGSVLSGMHYAVDGYVAALGVLGIWWLAGVITRSSRAGTAEPARNP